LSTWLRPALVLLGILAVIAAGYRYGADSREGCDWQPTTFLDRRSRPVELRRQGPTPLSDLVVLGRRVRAGLRRTVRTAVRLSSNQIHLWDRYLGSRPRCKAGYLHWQRDDEGNWQLRGYLLPPRLHRLGRLLTIRRPPWHAEDPFGWFERRRRHGSDRR